MKIVVWWKIEMLLLSTTQMNTIGLTRGPYWRDGKPIDGPYPQMTLFIEGSLR